MAGSTRLLAVSLCLVVLASPVSAEVEEELVNPFAGVETHYLSNGMRVWYRHMPDSPDVSLSVIVPYGSDRDPDGKEELAHFTEHMLFGDQPGRTEDEVKREVEDRGGRRNGITSPDRTYYYVTIDRQHRWLALDWIYRIVAPHEMTPEQVDRGRRPVAIEKSIRPRDLFDYVDDYYTDPHWMRTPNVWKSEFGIRTYSERGHDPYTSLESIDSEDLLGFYDEYYVPARMTLVVAGDMEREEVLARSEATFGTLPVRPTPEPYPPVTNPRRPLRYFEWETRANVKHEARVKIYDMTAEDHQILQFVRRLLEHRLKKLRYGDRKAVYSFDVSIRIRGPAAMFGIGARIAPEEYDWARSVIDEEIELIRTAGHSPEEFEEDRKSVILKLASGYREAQDIATIAARKFYDRDRYEDFPDLIGHFASLTQQDLAGLVNERFTEENELLWVVKPTPVPQAAILGGMAFIVLVVLGLAGRWLVRPVEMRKIRYVARFRRPWPYRILVTPLWLAALAVVARLVYFGYERATLRYVLAVDSYAFQLAFFAMAFAVAVVAAVVVLGAPPHKILVFDDHVRIKSRLYRSRSIPIDEIASVSLARFADLPKGHLLLKLKPLGLGLLRPAVRLETRRGRGYLFHVRDNEELVAVLDGLLRRRETPAA